jgi:hypothetical protein
VTLTSTKCVACPPSTRPPRREREDSRRAGQRPMKQPPGSCSPGAAVVIGRGVDVSSYGYLRAMEITRDEMEPLAERLRYQSMDAPRFVSQAVASLIRGREIERMVSRRRQGEQMPPEAGQTERARRPDTWAVLALVKGALVHVVVELSRARFPDEDPGKIVDARLLPAV